MFSATTMPTTAPGPTPFPAPLTGFTVINFAGPSGRYIKNNSTDFFLLQESEDLAGTLKFDGFSLRNPRI